MSKDGDVVVMDRRNLRDCPDLFADVILNAHQGSHTSTNTLSLSKGEAESLSAQLIRLLNK